MFVKVANRFGSDIFVEKDGEKNQRQKHHGPDDARRGPGSKVTLHVKGADASAAIAELEALVQRKFDED